MNKKFGGQIGYGMPNQNAMKYNQQMQMMAQQQQQLQQQNQYNQYEDEEEEGMIDIDLDQITNSMIMQEDIDENYEPTQEEVVEYAKYLGMDLINDKDLFYIAREGLKAPLPEPWRPVKHPSGEIFYLNMQTKEASIDHPCDSYYQDLFRKEKEKKMMKQTQQKMKQFTATEEDYGSVGKTQTKKSLPAVLPKHDIFSKKNDPLIKVTQEKKLNEYRNQQKQKLQERKKEIDEIYKKKFKQLEEQHNQKLEKIKDDYETKKQAEEDELQNQLEDLQNDEDSGFKQELERYEKEIREELRKTNKTRIDAEKKDIDMRLQSYKASIHQQYEDLLQKKKDEVKQDYDRKFKELEKEEQDLKNDSRFIEFNEHEELETLKQKFIVEQEEKFTRDKESVKRKYQEQLRQFKEKEMEKHQKRLDELYSNVQKETKIKSDFDEDSYKRDLEEELQEKLKGLQSEIENKFELEKLNILQKLKEYENKKKQEFEKKLETEIKQVEMQWQREKEKKEQELEIEKNKIEQKALDEYLTFKNNFEKQILNEEKKIRDLFNSEQEMKMEKEKISSEIIVKLQSELNQLTEECAKIQRENENRKSEQKQIKDEIDQKKKLIEYSEKEKQLLDEIHDKDKVINQLKLQIDELDEQEINLEMDEALNQLKSNNRGKKSNNQNLNIQEFDGYSSDGSGVINFQDNKNLQNALTQVSSEIDKEKQKLYDEKIQIQNDLQMLQKEYNQNIDNFEKKAFLMNVKGILEQKLSQVEKKLKHLVKVNGLVGKNVSSEGYTQNKQKFQIIDEQITAKNKIKQSEYESNKSNDMGSKFLSDYNNFLSKYQTKA